MPRIRLLCLSAVLCTGLFSTIVAVPCSAQTQERPNILLVYLDDFGWKDASFMGSDFYETPNLDRLASEGMIFTDAYSGAANCAPARACLLSGQYTPRHEVYNVGTRLRGNPKYSRLKHVPGTATLRPDIATWAKQIQLAGYKTATMGKWHLSKDPTAYGFDINIGGTHSGGPPRGYFPPHGKAPGLEKAPQGEYVTDRLSDEAVNFITANKDRPWLLYLTHFAVHSPFQAKKDLIAKYDKKKPGELHQSTVMAGMIESVDQGVGRIVAKLEELKLTDKTAIIFTSDNGGHGRVTSMKPLKGYKGSYYEGGIREPFFVNWPGVVTAGKKNGTPITGVDLYPTLCAIAGAKLPLKQPLDGVNLLPLFKGEKPDESRAIYWHFPAYLQSYANRKDGQRDHLFRTRPCSVIRHGDWKLHEYFEDGALELYNLRDDIGETKNLAKSNPAKTQELHNMLKAWRKEVKAPVPTAPNPQFDAAAEEKARSGGKILKPRKKAAA
jgi:arylsulfatase A-like enzyme